MSLPRLCIFARTPQPGAVKRRLAVELGAAGALRAHEALVEDTLARLAAIPGVISELWVWGEPNAVVERWAHSWDIAVRGQQGGDLGERMLHALNESLDAAPAAFVVGADCQDIDADYLADAITRLARADVVLAPAEDGGYGLIGARRSARSGLPGLFDHMPWGTGDVLELTLKRCRDGELCCSLLPEIWDVDTPADWQRFLARRRDS